MAEDLVTYNQMRSNKIAKKLNFPRWIPNWSAKDKQHLCSINIDKLIVYIARQGNATGRYLEENSDIFIAYINVFSPLRSQQRLGSGGMYMSRNEFGCPGVSRHGKKFEVKIKNSKIPGAKDRLFFGSFDTPEMAVKVRCAKYSSVAQASHFQSIDAFFLIYLEERN